MTRTIGILAGKGGVGKTTVAINLACTLGLLNKKVTLIDFNFTTSHLAIELGIIPKTTLNNVLRNEADLKNALYSTFGIDILPASLNLSELENIEMSDLKSKIKNLLNGSEIILLDSAPGFGREALLAMQASDEVIFVVNPTQAAIADVMKCKQLALQLGVIPLGIVVNRYKNKKFELRPDEIADLVELPLLSVIKENEDFLESEAARIPLIFYKRSQNEEFFKLACNLTGIEYKEPGLLRKFASRFI
jgi:MinD-like ATPase involved in chromosome partitioning or flagellar assembly